MTYTVSNHYQLEVASAHAVHGLIRVFPNHSKLTTAKKSKRKY
jgi:hypothetical protein